LCSCLEDVAHGAEPEDDDEGVADEYDAAKECAVSWYFHETDTTEGWDVSPLKMNAEWMLRLHVQKGHSYLNERKRQTLQHVPH